MQAGSLAHQLGATENLSSSRSSVGKSIGFLIPTNIQNGHHSDEAVATAADSVLDFPQSLFDLQAKPDKKSGESQLNAGSGLAQGLARGHLRRDATPDERRAYHRAYYRAHAEQHLREYYRLKNARYRAECPDMVARQRAYNVEYDKMRRHTPKQLAREKTKQAIRKGLLVKPDTCQRCGARGVIHAHHADYSQPMSITWLCRPCHDAEHRKIK